MEGFWNYKEVNVKEKSKKTSRAKAQFIEHRLATNYSSQFATGVIVSGHGSSPDQLPDHAIVQLTFYDDAITVAKEYLHNNEDGEVKTSINQPDVIIYREDKVRVSMTRSSARALYEALTRHFCPAEAKKEASS